MIISQIFFPDCTVWGKLQLRPNTYCTVLYYITNTRKQNYIRHAFSLQNMSPPKNRFRNSTNVFLNMHRYWYIRSIISTHVKEHFLMKTKNCIHFFNIFIYCSFSMLLFHDKVWYWIMKFMLWSLNKDGIFVLSLQYDLKFPV